MTRWDKFALTLTLVEVSALIIGLFFSGIIEP